MESIIDVLFPQGILKYDFLKSIKIVGDGYIEIIPKRFYGKGTVLLKAVGKNLMVSMTNLTYLQPVDHNSRDLPEYFHINLCQGTLRGIGGTHINKDRDHSRHIPAGFSHCSAGVSFLPGFFDTFFASRYGVTPGELTQAIEALGRFPLIPAVAVILKQIGEASFAEDIGNIWLEAKTVELVSVLLDWHRRLVATASPPLKEDDHLGILEAIRYVEEHSSGALTLDKLAKEAAMSMSKFTAAFKTHTGLSAASYVRRFRMEKAMELLKYTSIPLGEIAGEVGYNHSRFSTLFREQFGVAPSVFRKEDNKE
jgi:AraC-like DNA-binding protein